MAYGFELFNEAGYQIGGSDFANLVFYQKTRLVTTAYSFSGLPSDQPHLVIGSAVIPYDSSTMRVFRSVSGHRCTEQGGRIYSDTIGAVFDCYSFGPVIDDGTRIGMQVFDEQGQLTFNAERPYLKLVGVFTDPTPVVVPSREEGGDLSTPYTVQTPYAENGKEYATLLGNAHFYYYRAVSGSEARPIRDTVMVRIARLTADGIFDTVFSYLWMWTDPIAQDIFLNDIANKTAPMRMMVVDVTGL